MHQTKNQIYEIVKNTITRREFENKIKERKKEFDGLLDEDTLALMIVDELGRYKQNISTIKELKPGIETTIYGRVERIKNKRIFKRKNGSSGKVINLEIRDKGGICGLVLWDKDTELVDNNTITEGSKLKIINGYVKNGINGIEINIGRWSLLEVETEDIPEFNIKIENNSKKIKGEIININPTRSFFKDNGDFGFVTDVEIKCEDGLKKLIIWNEKVKEIRCYKKGDLIDIKNVDIRRKNGFSELHVTCESVIKKI